MPQDEGSAHNLHGMYFFLFIPALLTNLTAQILKEFSWYDNLLSVMGGSPVLSLRMVSLHPGVDHAAKYFSISSTAGSSYSDTLCSGSTQFGSQPHPPAGQPYPPANQPYSPTLGSQPYPAFVTRTSNAGMAPIHFPSCSCLLPIPWRLHTHTHAIPLLADCTLALPFLVIFPLIIFLSTCTISAHWISSWLTLCPFHLTGTHPIISWTPYPTIGLWHHHPLPHPRVVTQFPITLTIAPVCDSVSLYPYHTTSLWLSLLSACLFMYYYLQSGLCSLSPPI
jgi:hypothetical protein